MKIAGTDISDKKHIKISLQEIYGIGNTTAIKILNHLKIPYEKKTSDLSSEEQKNLLSEIEKYEIGSNLKRKILFNVDRLVSIKCYRGKRLKLGLPVNGRTHSNGKTSRRNNFYSKKSSDKKNLEKGNKK